MEMTAKKKSSLGWRLKATHERYQQEMKSRPRNCPCVLCVAPTLQDFTYWRIIDNKFPYDRIAKTHHMLVIKRHTEGEVFRPAELKELNHLRKNVLDETYSLVAEAVPKKKSVPGHFHLHLLVPRW